MFSSTNKNQFAPNYRKLAPRNLLSATFSFLGGQLVLDGFDAGQDLSLEQTPTIINGRVADAYLFELSSGSWTGVSTNPGIEIESSNGGLNNQLQIATRLFGSDSNSRIAIDGATGTPLNIDLAQLGSTLITGELRLSNITSVDSPLSFDIEGNVVLDNLAVVDSNPNDSLTTTAGINFNVRGDIHVIGDLRNTIDNALAGITLTTIGDTHDVSVLGNLITNSGSIILEANDSIFLGSDSAIVAGSSGNVFLTGGQDDASRIEFADGASIDSGDGIVAINLTNGQDILLGNVRSANLGTAITVNAGGSLIDITSDESANLVATNGSISIRTGGSIGSLHSEAADIDVEAVNLFAHSGTTAYFNSAVSNLDISVDGDLIVHNLGDLNLTDLNNDQAAVISRANRASVLITAGTRLQISNDMQLEYADRLSLFATERIENLAGAQILVDQGHLQVNAEQSIALGNQPGDRLRFQSVGLVSKNAHLEADAAVLIHGNAPNLDRDLFGTDASFGTRIDETLFVTSTNEIVQVDGDLYAKQLGLSSGGHVHLASIDAVNETLAILAAGRPVKLTDPMLIQQLDALSKIVDSEVDATAPQSIAFLHRGTATIGTVASPETTANLSGLISTNGSIFVSAVEAIKLESSIIANSEIVDPQVTIYVANGTIDDPRIEFESAAIRVQSLSNFGIVNDPFTMANFFDSEGFVLRGTTEDLVLNIDGSANQDIVIEYGHPGEAGYRIGVFWDNGRRPYNPTGQPVETLNTFVPNINNPSEAYDDPVYQNNPRTLQPRNGQEGVERGTFSKVGPYSKAAIINHQDDPKVFSLVTVRNDQHINLFAGSLATASNALNQTEQVIRADLDSPKKFAIPLPPISTINPLEIRTVIDAPLSGSAPQDISNSSFNRDVQPFETGDLKWVQVAIPLNDLTELGDEVVLKDPTKIYGPSDDAKPIPINGSIGENEVEEIIGEIERSRDAEPGFWFKIFKDYQNREDELFFYHLKTGDVPQPDWGPANDFAPATDREIAPQPEPESHIESESPDEHNSNGSSSNASNSPNDMEADQAAASTSNREQDSVQADRFIASSFRSGLSPNTASMGLSLGTLVMANLIQRRKTAPVKDGELTLTKSPDTPNTDFSKRARWKRKLDGGFN